MLATKDLQLVAQHQDLDLLRLTPTEARALGGRLLAVYAGGTDSDIVTANERIDAALDGSC